MVAHRDTRVPNWLDTEGHVLGLVFWRFVPCRRASGGHASTVLPTAGRVSAARPLGVSREPENGLCAAQRSRGLGLPLVRLDADALLAAAQRRGAGSTTSVTSASGVALDHLVGPPSRAEASAATSTLLGRLVARDEIVRLAQRNRLQGPTY
jgi:hypothetical protein